MKDFSFDLQKFVSLEATENGTILVMGEGETYTHDGVIYTSKSDQAGISLDSSGKVLGLASGIVQATAADSENPATLTLNASGGSFNFSVTSNGQVMTLTKNLPFELTNGTFTLAGNVLTVAKGSDLRIGTGKTYADGTTIFGHDYADTDIIYTITDTTLTEETEQETIIFTAASDAGSRSIKTVINGKVVNGTADGKFTGDFTVTENSSMSLDFGDYKVKATANSDATSNILVNSKGINIYPVAGDGNLNLSLSNKDREIISGVFECTNGAVTFGYDKSVTLAKGTSFNFAWNNYFTTVTANDDTTASVALTENGISLTPNIGDGTLTFTLGSDKGSMTAEVEILSGSFIFGNDGSLNVAEGTELQFKFSDDYIVKLKATNAAGGSLSVGENGITFTPNIDDGGLQISVTKNGETRTAFLNVSGSLTYNLDGSISLAEGTVVKNTFEDGNKLTLNSRGSNGYINLDLNKGLGITSANENLDMIFTSSSGYQTSVSGIQGTVWYNAGKITIDENTKLTGTGSLGGQGVNVTLEAIGGDGFLIVGSSGMNYGAGTGKLKVTISKDNLASTFTVNKGEVLIGHNIFNIAVGSDIATDLQSFIPALSFVTTAPGEYTINGRTITTTAPNLALTATDNQMVFKTSSDAVEYEGMTFAGSGNVTLTPAAVALGNGVVATGFDADNTFILNEQGTVTADEKIFELTEPIATGISVKGAENGFIFSRTLTKESEERLGYYDSPDIGKVFSEEFHSTGDNSYRIETDLIRLEKISGISDGATITGGATLDGVNSPGYYVLGTDSNGKFTIGEKTYTLNDDNQVGTEIRARFDNGTAYADRINNLKGVVSGDFTAGTFKINDGSLMQVFGDTNVSIYANENGYEIYGLDDGASLKVLDAGTYVVNSTTIETNGTNFIVGNSDGSARLLYENYLENGTSGNTVTGTENNDVIYNIGANTEIYGLGGSDTITNVNASNVYINAGEGDNVITENLNYEIANIDGQDTLLNYHENNSIVAGSGNDNIYNKGGYYLSVASGAGNDTVRNIHGYYPTINTGAGDDSVVVEQGHYQYVDAGDGNDSIIGSFASGDWAMGGHATLVGGNGNDYIDATDTNDASILGGQGNDTILASAVTASENSIYIDGEDGDDYIQNANDNSQIYAGDGNNSIDSYGSNVTIEAGNGNDTVNNKVASNVLINVGDGDNVITEILDYEVANVNGKDTLLNYYENSTVIAGAGNDSIYNVGGYYLNLTSGDGNDTVTNIHGYYPTINTGAGDDSVVIGKGHYQNINTGEGNDVIIGSVIGDGWAMGGYANIEGGAGNDYIDTGYTNDSKILGNEGNDTIITTGTNSTIDGGAGDDYIVLNRGESDNYDLINYVPEDGNDTIIGFCANDTLKIDGEAYSVKSGNDLIVTVGDSRITLIDAANLSNPNIEADKNPLVELTETILKRTEAGYPVMAAIAFSPDEVEIEPTNYATKEDWNITSSDNLKLHAVHYTPENSNDKWVMLIHGYGNNHTAMYPYLGSYLDNGYNVLMIDQRAAGESEGEWLTMGTAESADVALWTQEIARRNSNAKITLHGVSMGAATAMLAAARPDITNLTSIVEDCGYSNVMDTFSLVNDAVLHQPTEVIAALDPVSASLTGYYLHDAAPINSISSVTVPSLFISGSEDAVAPVSMLSALYEASGAEVKEQYIVGGASHARAVSYDPAGYANVLFSFVAEADGEGRYIDNETDSIYLRGTSYNDTISTSGANVTVDAGAGENIVSLSGSSETVIFSGKTTVEGFTTGFGDCADALYINQSPPGVDFSENGLTFLSSTDSVTFSDIHHTAKIDLYHTQNPQVTLASAVVLAEDEWYSVTDNDLAIRNDYKQGLYFVGGTTTANHGVDFSNIAQDVNVTVDTEYELEDVHLWINNVHSIKGGAGNTTITGSTDNDTIFSGGGQSSLWGNKGDDYLEGSTSYDTFVYKFGDGKDTIKNAGSGDLIFLSDVSMSQILSANITSESVALNLNDGGSINIFGAGEIYQLANGSRYSADRENLSWNAID